MQAFSCALLLSLVAVPAVAQDLAIGVATNAEKDTPFRDLAECEKALNGEHQAEAPAAGAQRSRGSILNRQAGNILVCAMSHGEPRIIVYPKGAAVGSLKR